VTAVLLPGERIAVPDGYRLSLKAGKIAPGIPGDGVSVVILPPGVRSVVEALTGPPRIHAAVTHDRGSIWPDEIGRQMVEAALSGGGAAVLQFKCGADARRCRDLLKTSASGAGEASR
jgi:hypothetical protein